MTATALERLLCEPADASPARRLFRALHAALPQSRADREEWRALVRLAHDESGKQRAIRERRAALEALVGAPLGGDAEYDVLFCLHTTHAVLVKAVAHTVLGVPIDGDDLRATFEDWESGRPFRDAGITNVIVSDPFGWYCHADVWTPALADGCRDILEKLAEGAGACDAPPAAGRPPPLVEDLFYGIYQRILPAKVRHSLGEFYTPRWLADSVAEAALRGVAPGWTAIDPCCGSGVFVLSLLARVLTETEGAPAADRLQAVLTRVSGADLNPLALLTARVNYFIAIAPLLRAADAPVTIPIHVADACALDSRPDLPSVDIVAKPERAMSDGRIEGAVPPSFRTVDIVIGNPPWVDWKNLPAEYRARLRTQGVDRRLFSGDARTGGINLNICALVANVCADRWLAPEGRLALLMPRSLLFQQSYEGFRAFQLRDGRAWIQEIVDWTEAGHPFAPVTERFYTYVVSRAPVDYRGGIPRRVMLPCVPLRIVVNDRRWHGDVETLFTVREEVIGQVRDGTGFTTAVDTAELSAHLRVAGHCAYTGREGVELYPQHVYLHTVVGTVDDGVRVRGAAGERTLEPDLLFPLVKGPEIQAFHHSGSEFVVPFPYDAASPRRPVDREALRARAPRTLELLDEHREILVSQARQNARLLGQATEFYAIARVGAYTFAPHHVAFRDNTSWGAAVFSAGDTPWGGRKLPLFQNHAVSIAEHESGRFITEDEAHYVCAILNAPAVARFVLASSDARTFKIRPQVRVPTFDPTEPAHRGLAALSREAHARAAAGDREAVHALAGQAEELYLGIVSRAGD